jgi:hypothetical protein
MENVKEISFTITLSVYDKPWEFWVRKHPSEDTRFNALLNDGKDEKVEFVLIRSSIGKWVLSGESVPRELTEHAEFIGKSFEEHIRNS